MAAIATQEGKDWSADAKKILEEHREAEFEKKLPIGGGDVGFRYSPDQLNSLVDPKNAFVLREMGGIEGLAGGLGVDLNTGLTDQQATDSTRLDVYGRNVLPERKTKSLLKLMWIALQDKVLIILSVAAVVSLALGIYETVGEPPEYDDQGHKLPKVDWVEGVAILVAVVIVVTVGAVNDWQKERQFAKLNKKKEDRKVKAIRNGKPSEISVYDVVVGDILLVEPGEMIPTDGILVNGYNIKCDESSASGESDTMKKHPAKEVVDAIDHKSQGLNPQSKELDAFMLSGAKVLEGTGQFLTIAVGEKSLHGRTMMSLQDEPEATPLQEKLNNIAEGIAKLGFAAAIVLFVALMIRFFVQLPGSVKTPSQKGEEFMTIFITAVTIVVVAVPEGLPLAVTLALAFATTRMVKDNNLVRVLKSCETMGGATTICSDKTGTLTQNRMSVVAATVGFKSCEASIDGPADDQEVPVGDKSLEKSHDKNYDTASEDVLSPSQLVGILPETQFTTLLDSIALNSSAFEDNSPEATEPFLGSKTETALLGFARNYMNLGELLKYRQAADIVQVFPFDSAKKFMATIVRTSSGSYQVLLKGASEVVLSRCTQILDTDSFTNTNLTAEHLEFINNQINLYASKSLRTIGLVYKDLPADWSPDAPYALEENTLFKDMTFLTLVGIKDPLRPGVKQAVADCKTAGVVVRMVTGDNINTARAIALDCGILTSANNEDEIVMEGPEFRKLNPFELNSVVPKLRVLARSSPQDKRKLVKFLKSLDETVAVTGDGTNDAPALKLADIGFSMGIAGTEVAKEASDVILMDDNFGSIVKAIKWGRTVNDAVKKFLQFQLTVNVTAVLLTFISAVADSDDTSVLTAVQLLWVNLIMDTFAALALATDPPSDSVLHRKPDNRKASLITVTMWKMILGQAIFQLIVTFVLHFAGSQIFNVDTSVGRNKEQLSAMVFNTFVWLQFFNMFVNRRLDNHQNIFEGVHRNIFFILIAAIIGGMQIVIMFVGGAAFSVVKQTGAMWGTALICGMISIPAGVILRLVPDEWVAKLYPARAVNWAMSLLPRKKSSKGPEIIVDEESTMGDPQQYVWPAGIEQVRRELVFLKTVRGGRVLQLNFKPKSIYNSWKEALTPSSASTNSINSPHSPSSTLAPNSYFTDYHSNSNNGGNFLSVPGRRKGSNIAALAVVPAVVGGAIGGWSPELSTNPPPPSSPDSPKNKK
ncbi:calcium-transporting ATPase PMC1 [Sugiyamaella lignohabitans]|uniref:Calcium-transporting ATPase n=1 Tax=Sugiyamaella lignohabitans TaxID=796027 RepID=A0A161HIQ6_9ASCO|nr:calcium-transporting ATPase PMC1 [Sugiyamaella lignohabitans]ANB11088.1 calcium-transporting ATPase PMC1 [Sugiyamaella lignohabitans]